MNSALGYVEETLLNAEIVKLVPESLAPVVGGLLSRCLNSHKIFFRRLIPATEQRIREKDAKNLGHKVPERVCNFPSFLFSSALCSCMWADIFYTGRLYSVDHRHGPEAKPLVRREGYLRVDGDLVWFSAHSFHGKQTDHRPTLHVPATYLCRRPSKDPRGVCS